MRRTIAISVLSIFLSWGPLTTVGSQPALLYFDEAWLPSTDGWTDQDQASPRHLLLPPRRVVGVDYGPFREGQQPGGPCPSLDEIRADIGIWRWLATTIRTYSVLDCLIGEKVLTAVQEVIGLQLCLGLWLSGDRTANAQELAELTRLQMEQGLHRVICLVVGSETLWRGDLPVDELIGYIQQVKALVPGIPVSTAEPWHIWLGQDARYPELGPLVEAVDAIFPNIHPYWEAICLDHAVEAVFERVSQLQHAYPTTRVVISETGWPSHGESNGCAVPSLANQRRFLTEFLCQALQAKMNLFYFVAFDESWKVPPEVEAHWGVFYADRTPKHSFNPPPRCPVLLQE